MKEKCCCMQKPEKSGHCEHCKNYESMAKRSQEIYNENLKKDNKKKL